AHRYPTYELAHSTTELHTTAGRDSVPLMVSPARRGPAIFIDSALSGSARRRHRYAVRASHQPDSSNILCPFPLTAPSPLQRSHLHQRYHAFNHTHRQLIRFLRLVFPQRFHRLPAHTSGTVPRLEGGDRPFHRLRLFRRRRERRFSSC